MRMMQALAVKRLLLCLALVALMCVGGPLYAQEDADASPAKPTLIVLPLAANNVPEDVAESLTDMMLLELDRAQLYRVIGQKDLQSMLSAVELKQLMGAESEAHMEAIRGKIESDYLLRGSVGQVGATYLVSLTLLNVRTAEVVRRVNQSVAGSADDLIGSVHAAVVALALEEEGVPPKLTAGLVESLQIARKKKTLFLRFGAGWEMAVGPYNNDATMQYILPDLMTFNLSAGWQALDWLQVVFETGAALSIAEQFQTQPQYEVSRYYRSDAVAAAPNEDKIDGFSETNVITNDFKYQTFRIPFNVMARFQPSSGRLLPFVQLGLGISWQRYHMEAETLGLAYSNRDSQSGAACRTGYTADGTTCIREETLNPVSADVDFVNLQVPLAAGVDYLITQHFGIGFEVRYLLTYALNATEDDLMVKFESKEMKYITQQNDLDNAPAGTLIAEEFSDRHPIRRLHHGMSVLLGVFYYY